MLSTAGLENHTDASICRSNAGQKKKGEILPLEMRPFEPLYIHEVGESLVPPIYPWYSPGLLTMSC